MDSSELPHLPPNLPLASQLPSGFNSNEAHTYQGFPTAIGDIEHNLQAPTTFPQLNSHVNGNGRFNSTPSSRPVHIFTASDRMTSGRAEPLSQVLNSHGELEWVAASISSSLQSTQKGSEHVSPSGDPGDGSEVAGEITDSHMGSMKIVPDPPDLEAWRERLFNVDEPITLTEEQFQTYFPHVDNVYSHRSTQKYKRKPFVSHYWDCRLKGRPSGTPKSNDPNKKKRKRVARERDLCDVKIKITEYLPRATTADSPDQRSAMDASSSVGHATTLFFTSGEDMRRSQPFGVLTPSTTLSEENLAARGQRLFTIQRVNGNGGNGKADGIGGGHRHTLVESDSVKKNSVQRYLQKKAKDEKRVLYVEYYYDQTKAGPL